jgi:hypothetical protein
MFRCPFNLYRINILIHYGVVNLATYPVYNKVTGEQKEIILSVHDWEQWKKDNSEWDRDWSDPSTCPSSGELGEVYDKLKKSHPGWNDVLSRASKVPGSKVKPV